MTKCDLWFVMNKFAFAVPGGWFLFSKLFALCLIFFCLPIELMYVWMFSHIHFLYKDLCIYLLPLISVFAFCLSINVPCLFSVNKWWWLAWSEAVQWDGRFPCCGGEYCDDADRQGYYSTTLKEDCKMWNMRNKFENEQKTILFGGRDSHD